MALGTRESKQYITILGDGTLRTPVPEGTENAVTREYETSDGKKGTKTELVFANITGMITNIEVFDGKFGMTLNVSLMDGDETYILSIGVDSSFGEDFMKKLPNIDLTKEVYMAPYSFTDDNGKSQKGISIQQDAEKIPNYYWDVAKKTSANGYPTPEGDTKKFTKPDWKIFYMQANKFLLAEATKLIEKSFAPKTPDNGDF